jgi:hypothetical protein
MIGPSAKSACFPLSIVQAQQVLFVVIALPASGDNVSISVQANKRSRREQCHPHTKLVFVLTGAPQSSSMRLAACGCGMSKQHYQN